MATDKDPMVVRIGIGSARKARSSVNLKSIVTAVHVAEDSKASHVLRPQVDARGRLMHGWQTRLLPYLENGELHDRIDFARPWNDPRNREPMGTTCYIFNNPAEPGEPKNAAGYALSHYAGNGMVMGANAPARLQDIPDGASRTIVAGEAKGDFKPWGHPANWRDARLGINQSPQGFGSPYAGGANFTFGGTETRFITNDIDPAVFRSMCDPADGGPAEATDGQWQARATK
jgi:hypothetical protein